MMERTHRLPNRVRANSRALLDLQGLLSDPTLRGILQRFKSYKNGERLEKFERLLYEGFAYHFYEAIEESKIRLSSESETSISFHRPGLDIDIPITRAEFDALIEYDIGLLQETIVEALADAGVNAVRSSAWFKLAAHRQFRSSPTWFAQSSPTATCNSVLRSPRSSRGSATTRREYGNDPGR